jgi:hypothetical protein
MVHTHVDRLLGAYLDDELPEDQVRKVRHHLAGCSRCQIGLAKIRDGARLADSLPPVTEPPTLWADVQSRLTAAPPPGRWVGLRSLRLAPIGVVLAGLVVLTTFGLSFLKAPAASASQVLGHSDSALIKSVKPGELLYRRWRVTRVESAPNALTTRTEFVEESWLGGPNLNHNATRLLLSGRVVGGYSNVSGDGVLRSHTFYAPGYPGLLRNLHIIHVTAEERQQAVANLPAADRELVTRFFDTPQRPAGESMLLWENLRNRAMLRDPESEKNPFNHRTLLSIEPAVMPNGEAVHRIRHLNVGLPWLDLREDGSGVWRLGRAATTSYISKTSYLTVKIESDMDREDGTRIVATRDLEEVRSVPKEAAGRPFDLEVPPGTVEVRADARTQMMGLAAVLRRATAESTTDAGAQRQ